MKTHARLLDELEENNIKLEKAPIENKMVIVEDPPIFIISTTNVHSLEEEDRLIRFALAEVKICGGGGVKGRFVCLTA